MHAHMVDPTRKYPGQLGSLLTLLSFAAGQSEVFSEVR